MIETILALFAIGTTLLGGAVTYAGIQQQGAAARQQADYQAGVEANNAILAQRAAADAVERGAVTEANKRQQTAALKGRQLAVLASNGVLVNQGSALDLTSDTASIGELDALTIKSNAQREALGYQTQGMNFSNSAELSRLRGENAQSAAGITGAASLLGTAGTVAKGWYNFNYGKPGVGGFI